MEKKNGPEIKKVCTKKTAVNGSVVVCSKAIDINYTMDGLKRGLQKDHGGSFTNLFASLFYFNWLNAKL